MLQLKSRNKTNSNHSRIQAKLTIGQPCDKYEQEADTVADKVMRMSDNHPLQMQPEEEEEEMLQPKLRMQPEEEEEEMIQMQPVEEEEEMLQPKIQRQEEEEEEPIQMQTSGQGNRSTYSSSSIVQQINSSKGKGSSLLPETNQFMSQAMGADFKGVHIHTDNKATQMNQNLNAKAFTHGSDIFFNKEEYKPQSSKGKRLLAHELTHVVQQGHGKNDNNIQRTIELRPPGRGEATAFDRADELVARINRQSMAVSYSLGADGRTLNYDIIIPSALSNFDSQMMEFIDHEQVLPMRLITSSGTVGGSPIVGDSFQHGYVDVEDMLASDDLAFQSILIHFLEERAVTPRYAERMGTLSDPAFNRGHRAGHDAQAEHWRDVMGDPDIQYSTEFINNRGDGHIVFRSRPHDYRIYITLDRAATSSTGRAPNLTTGGRTRVRYNNQWYSVEDFLDLGIVPGRFNDFRLRPGNSQLTLPPSLSLHLPQLQLDPNIQQQIRNLRSLGNLTPSSQAETEATEEQQSNLTIPSSSPSTLQMPQAANTGSNQIDWFTVNRELNSRGVQMDESMAQSVESVWNTNYMFFNGLGFNNSQSTILSNRTIGMAVGSGISYDHPTFLEQSDRELGTSTTIIPASDIVLFLWNEIRD